MSNSVDNAAEEDRQGWFIAGVDDVKGLHAFLGETNSLRRQGNIFQIHVPGDVQDSVRVVLIDDEDEFLVGEDAQFGGDDISAEINRARLPEDGSGEDARLTGVGSIEASEGCLLYTSPSPRD